jgi:release factor glutamine methyltransferase
MFVSSNLFSEVKRWFRKEVSSLYSDREIKQLLKHLFIKRFSGSDTDYLLADDVRLSESDLLFFRSATKRLKNNEPIQYIIGETQFYGLTILCDHRALIPRPETEELVDWIVTEHDGASIQNILDLCTGSGCIALALKKTLPKVHVTAIEWSDKALELVKENAAALSIAIDPIKADVLHCNYENILPKKQDVIVSNPPYIPRSDKQLMQRNVLDFEPEMALFVEDNDALIFYREITNRSKAVLKDGGWVYFEIHEDLSNAIVALLKKLNFVNIEVRKDLQGKDRMVRAQLVNCTS